MKIDKASFADRRKKLMEQMGTSGLAIIPAARMMKRNSDVEHAFRQDSDFYYLTGFNEPDAILVLIPGRPEGEVVLFCRDRDPLMEIWNGYRAGPEGAVNDYGAAEAYAVDDIDDR